ncbi:PadR family transcriptional regulator [Mammaliicoccus vitulinus]|uniref:PadR family transcriptional regulator n=1 Tax=Mammaliicoccus vitulinus TaxID=71237 RepID=UPI003617DA12
MAQKNILQYVLLGLLKNESLSGYDIKKAFEKDIGEFWQANHSQIYPQLKKLNERALIDKKIVIAGEKLEKRCTLSLIKVFNR